MKITIDTDTDTFGSAIRTLYVAYGFDVDDAQWSTCVAGTTCWTRRDGPHSCSAVGPDAGR
jgi:hypothetical protein